MPDLIDHEINGYLARPFEPSDLARGISRLLDGAERAQEMSRNARRKIEAAFAIESVAKRHLDLYGSLSTPRGPAY